MDKGLSHRIHVDMVYSPTVHGRLIFMVNVNNYAIHG